MYRRTGCGARAFCNSYSSWVVIKDRSLRRLELCRRNVTEGRVESLEIVDDVDEVLEACAVGGVSERLMLSLMPSLRKLAT
jgi:hypothetical protein